MYYALILVSVGMFAVQFFLSSLYAQSCTRSLYSTMVSSVGAGIVGTVCLLLINGVSLYCTPFTFLMALWSTVNSLLFTFCGIAALQQINLSLYSAFSMIGGMLLPFAAGILFWSEGITWAKVLCFLLIAVGMCFTFEASGKKGNVLYYLGIFVFNGMSGVISMVYSHAAFPKGSSADYSLLSSLLRLAVSGTVLLYLIAVKKEENRSPKITWKIVGILAGVGVLGHVANYFLLIALAHVPGSMQYPMVTGGVMICSTVIGFFTKKQPRKKDVAAVAVSFVGLLCLLLPI